jgi:hypothetical protein
VVTTGSLFALITLAHLWRMAEERAMATRPWYIAVTVAAAFLAVWAWRVARRLQRP